MTEADPGGGVHSDRLIANDAVALAVALLMDSESRSAEGALEVLEARAREQHVGLSESAQEIIDSLGPTDAASALPDGFADRTLNRTHER